MINELVIDHIRKNENNSVLFASIPYISGER